MAIGRDRSRQIKRYWAGLVPANKALLGGTPLKPYWVMLRGRRPSGTPYPCKVRRGRRPRRTLHGRLKVRPTRPKAEEGLLSGATITFTHLVSGQSLGLQLGLGLGSGLGSGTIKIVIGSQFYII